MFAHKKGNNKPETTKPNLSGVAETLLIMLYIRATESQRPDALVKDERAAALAVRQRVSPRSLDVRQLRQKLIEQRANLGKHCE